jgi:hypothetical protein
VNLEPPSGSKISVKTDGAPPVILVPHGSWPHRYSLEAVVRRRSPRSSGLPRFLASRLDPAGVMAMYWAYRLFRPTVPESLRLMPNGVTYDSGIPSLQIYWGFTFPKDQ